MAPPEDQAATNVIEAPTDEKEAVMRDVDIPDAVADAGAQAEAEMARIRERTAAKRGESAEPQDRAEVETPSPARSPGTPPAPAPDAHSVEDQPPTGVDAQERELRRLREENTGLKTKLGTQAGEYGGNLESLRQENEELRRRSAAEPEMGVGPAVQDPPPAAPAPSTRPAPPPVAESRPVPDTAGDTTSGGNGQSPAVIAGDQDVLRYVDSALKDEVGPEVFQGMADVTRAMIENEQAKGGDDSQELQRLRDQLQNQQLWADIEHLAPGAGIVNGDPTCGIPCTPGWKSFLEQPVAPGLEMTRLQVAEDSLATGKTSEFASLVRMFQSEQQAATAAAATDASASQTRGGNRPAPSVVPRPVRVRDDDERLRAERRTDPAKRMVPLSEVRAFQEVAGRQEYSPEEADRLMQEYDLAHREGRVDPSA